MSHGTPVVVGLLVGWRQEETACLLLTSNINIAGRPTFVWVHNRFPHHIIHTDFSLLQLQIAKKEVNQAKTSSNAVPVQLLF